MPYIRNGKVQDSPGWWLSLITFLSGLLNALIILVRTVFDADAAKTYVESGQRRRPPDRGPGGSGGGGGGKRIVGFGEMKSMGNPPCGGGG
ncbi:MAG: hypothetical protein J3K34DRAFT_414755 [Monoraphidium minutum]|nr:MAG: hypothetical protein J3K34DRAFT_414755 [Monoraphidium minutum]